MASLYLNILVLMIPGARSGERFFLEAHGEFYKKGWSVDRPAFPAAHVAEVVIR